MHFTGEAFKRGLPGGTVYFFMVTFGYPAAQGFNTWSATGQLAVAVEAGSPWVAGLAARGHNVEERAWGDGLFGHAHMIDVVDDHFEGVADPRALTGAAIVR